MKLYSLETNLPINIGAVVEYLPMRAGKNMMWVKVLAIDTEKQWVQLRSAYAGQGWYDPADIGAYIGPRRTGKGRIVYAPATAAAR